MAAVDVDMLIKRIKCDLNRIVLEKAYTQFPEEVRPERRQPFLFLRSWAAKVRLTVAVDDTFAVSPGASYTQPLHTVTNVAQTFTLGAGGSLSTEAVRQEDLEFLLSFKDIDAENDSGRMNTGLYEYCQQPPGLLLESDLGLDRLIDAALKPVETGVLKPGNNFGPGVGPPPAIPKVDLPTVTLEKRKVEPRPELTISQLQEGPEKIRQFSTKLIQKFNIPEDLTKQTAEQLNKGQTQADQNAARIKQILGNATEATSIETKTQAIINNVIKPRYGIAQGTLDSSCIKPVTEAQFEAIAQSSNVSAFVINIDKAAESVADRPNAAPPSPADDDALKAAADKSSDDFNKLVAARDKVIDASNTMTVAMRTCLRKTEKIQEAKKKEGPPVFDPVSTITETINFYVTVTGNVAPTWKLVRVTAPTAGTFLSGSRKDTNTLILSMGRPTPGQNGGPPNTSAMDSQILYSILGQAISASRP
ncbi:hypothetical protein [Bradyrhizobium sp. AS23.2]|uniref:hypothetical protein n=1 Tax=Bradyrhizobium sp. AS23.2 TaxID=1680155 RepID=UPI00116150DC|nr:hypothetical protein [Bradyrhizobium sp. AS23.2]